MVAFDKYCPVFDSLISCLYAIVWYRAICKPLHLERNGVASVALCLPAIVIIAMTNGNVVK